MFNQSFILITGNFIAAFFNYLFHLISGRLLDLHQYGEFESLLTFGTLIAIFSSSFNPALVKIFSNTSSNHLRFTLKNVESKILPVFLAQLIILSILYPLVNYLIHINQPFIYFCLIAQVSLTIFLTLYLAVFQSKSLYLIYGIIGICFSVVKNILTILLSLLGLGISSPYIALVVSTFAAVLIARRLAFNKWPDTSAPVSLEIKLWSYSLLSLLSNLGLILLISQDILLARHYFSEDLSGIYSAIAVIGKIILFSVTPLQTIVLPYLLKDIPISQKIRHFLLVLLLTLVGSIGLSIAYYLFKGIIPSLLYNSNYSSTTSYIFPYAVFISLYTILSLFILFFISQKSIFSAIIPFSVSLLQLFIFSRFQPNISSLINSLIYSELAGVAVCIFVFSLVLRRHFSGIKIGSVLVPAEIEEKFF